METLVEVRLDIWTFLWWMFGVLWGIGVTLLALEIWRGGINEGI